MYEGLVMQFAGETKTVAGKQKGHTYLINDVEAIVKRYRCEGQGFKETLRQLKKACENACYSGLYGILVIEKEIERYV
ncbi:hypothetical protein [Bacillus thuringiensis]|uniref:hypothetical protein n=1 Tax=Bacillus thuringiensis TaxID=1428 RepID=UPI000BFB65EF|nr:hypothetical protein [Bacillus thuringiensis]PGT89841.1 hypothetical protein COD17_08820 [Bacillus thuringiensis]